MAWKERNDLKGIYENDDPKDEFKVRAQFTFMNPTGPIAEVSDSELVIRSGGLQRDKNVLAIPLDRISAINFKKAGLFAEGTLSFITSGLSIDSDECYIPIQSKEHNTAAEHFKEFVLARSRKKASSPSGLVASPPPSSTVPENRGEDSTKHTRSIADELRSLKELLDAGILTPDEFEAAKKRLIYG